MIGEEILRGLHAEYIIALGESQSALFLTTYINAVDPLAQVYDGFLVHSRFGPAAPLDGGSIFDVLETTTSQAVRFRSDLRVPLVTIITETDLFGGRRQGYHSARQPDNQWLRVWEIAGTAHADNYTIQVAPIDTGSAALADIVAALRADEHADGSATGPLHQFRAAAPLCAAGGAVASLRLGAHRPAAAQWRTSRIAAPPSPFSMRMGSRRAGSGRRGWMCRLPEHPVTGATTARWHRSSAPVNRSTPRPCAGSTRRGRGVSGALRRGAGLSDRAGFVLAADREEIVQLAAAMFPSVGAERE